MCHCPLGLGGAVLPGSGVSLLSCHVLSFAGGSGSWLFCFFLFVVRVGDPVEDVVGVGDGGFVVDLSGPFADEFPLFGVEVLEPGVGFEGLVDDGEPDAVHVGPEGVEGFGSSDDEGFGFFLGDSEGFLDGVDDGDVGVVYRVSIIPGEDDVFAVGEYVG